MLFVPLPVGASVSPEVWKPPRTTRKLRWGDGVIDLRVPPPLQPSDRLRYTISQEATSALTRYFADQERLPFVADQKMPNNRLVPEMRYMYDMWEERATFSLDDWLLALLAQDHPVLDRVFFRSNNNRDSFMSAYKIRCAGIDKIGTVDRFDQQVDGVIALDDPFRTNTSACMLGLSVGLMQSLSQLVMDDIVRPIYTKAKGYASRYSRYRNIIEATVFATAVFWAFRKHAHTACSYGDNAFHVLMGVLTGQINCQLSYFILAAARTLNLTNVYVARPEGHVVVHIREPYPNDPDVASLWCVLETTYETISPWEFIDSRILDACTACMCEMSRECRNEWWWNERYNSNMKTFETNYEQTATYSEANIQMVSLAQRILTCANAWYNNDWRTVPIDNKFNYDELNHNYIEDVLFPFRDLPVAQPPVRMSLWKTHDGAAEAESSSSEPSETDSISLSELLGGPEFVVQP